MLSEDNDLKIRRKFDSLSLFQKNGENCNNIQIWNNWKLLLRVQYIILLSSICRKEKKRLLIQLFTQSLIHFALQQYILLFNASCIRWQQFSPWKESFYFSENIVKWQCPLLKLSSFFHAGFFVASNIYWGTNWVDCQMCYNTDKIRWVFRNIVCNGKYWKYLQHKMSCQDGGTEYRDLYFFLFPSICLDTY